MSAYDERAFAMAVAEQVETLGRACADRIVVDLTIGTFRVKRGSTPARPAALAPRRGKTSRA
jgi:hypothetical protein